jgi:hypothetical protein
VVAFVALTAFQVINTLTANYGFFTYLSLALHLFLLDDIHLGWLARRLPRWVVGDPGGSSLRPPAIDDATHRAFLATIASGYVALCLIGGVVSFAPRALGPGLLRDTYGVFTPFRVANVYHLFGHITRERIEVVLEAQQGDRWHELSLPWKPGDPSRAPAIVAPHQPRLDFLLWFYGLSARAGAPEYVVNLTERLCRDPASVQDLFDTPLPSQPNAIRIRFYRYRFANAEDHQNGTWWTRQELGTWGPRPCINTP